MGINKEYVCLAHGDFETSEDPPICPAGCDCVERRFFTPPAVFRSNRTKNIDKTLDSLAASHNLTDLGPAAMRRKALAAEKGQAAYKDFCERRFGGMGWGATPKGGTMNVKTGEIKGEGPGAASAAAKAGATGSVDIQANKPLLESFRRPVLVKKDHENLSVEGARAP